MAVLLLSKDLNLLCAAEDKYYTNVTVVLRLGRGMGSKYLIPIQEGCVMNEATIGAFIIVEMLYSSSLLAIVGAGEQPSLSPRRLCLFNTTTGTALRELNFLTSVLAVCINRKRLIVVLQEKTYVYDTNSLAILDTIDTVPNLKGLCAFSPSLDGCFLALPASTVKGSVLVYNVMELHSHCEIDAHRSPLAAMVLSSNGMYIATASEQGTIIRVHLVSEATKQSYNFRRGTYPSTIFSLSFGPSMQHPDTLVATSSSGSVHAFSLGFNINQSYAVIRKVDKVADSIAESVACRATVSIITSSGYFLEYTLSINHQNESSWILEREFNLLTVISEGTINS
ncbi:hypothetical protein RHGRI_009210 [Rhododendron griersonianum]|uniref:Autophagy-related protein 18b n=1 Tax=Rhododendron griersonianum TaxID=479676 RepID=A0AAV6L3W6_9ERIC|nr:hypothetical protein RHGRI_009210 [Rhododendron griersonianum]